MKYRAGIKVMFTEVYSYEDECPHCSSEITTYIDVGEIRTITGVTDKSVRLYDVNLSFEEADEYLEIVDK